MLRIAPVFLLLTVCGLCSSSRAQEAPADRLVGLDVFALEVAADPQISPDGTRIAYVRQSFDIMTDQPKSEVWIVRRDGSEHRPLLSGPGSNFSPRWSPDGSRLAYLSSGEGRAPELSALWMDTGQSGRLSNVPLVPRAISWSPDGTQIALVAFVRTEKAPLAGAPRAPSGAKWAKPPTVIDSVHYRVDGQGSLEPGSTQLFVIPAAGGAPRQLTTGEFNHNGPLSWSPDSRRIVFAANRNPDREFNDFDSDLWSVEVRSGELRRLTEQPGSEFSPAYSPDGSSITYLQLDDTRMGYRNSHVYLLDVTRGSSRNLTPDLDRSVDDVRWAGSSKRLYIQYDDHGKRHLARLSLDGKITDLEDNVGSVILARPYLSGGFSVANNGTYAYSAGCAYRPADVAVGQPGRAARRVTTLNDELLQHKRLGEVEAISWRAGEYEVQGWMVMPPNFDPAKRSPLILEIHGGPVGAYGPQFAAELQLYAAAGYVVLYANPRGSSSYGDKFANEIHQNFPGRGDYEDLMSGVDAVLARGYIDPARLYVSGESAGGLMTAWIVGRTDRFAAAAAVKPVINWSSFSLSSDMYTIVAKYWFDKPAWEDPQEYWRRSPLSTVGHVTTPTLLMVGENDLRTPSSEAEQFFQALKLRRIDSALVRVPGASHDLTARPSQLIAKVDNVLAWFQKYRKESSAAPVETGTPGASSRPRAVDSRELVRNCP